MPITFLEKRTRPQRLGRVRLGILKESKKDGQWWCNNCKGPTQAKYVRDIPKCQTCGYQLVYPGATPYFVLKDAPELAQFCDSEEPTRLNIEFLSENPEFTFPHYLRRYTGGGVNCLGDGAMVFYRVNAQQVVDVRDGNAVKPGGKVVMDADNQPVKVACEGSQCSFYLTGACKPTGFLRFVPAGAPRLGYYDVVCHQHAVIGIKTQLALCDEIFHHITGIPFVLHRGEEEKMPIPGKGLMPVRTQWIEIDPDWFAENYPLRDKHRAISAAKVQQDIVELFGEDGNGDGEPSASPRGNGDFAEPLFEGEAGGTMDEETGEIAGMLPDVPPEPEGAIPEMPPESELAEPESESLPEPLEAAREAPSNGVVRPAPAETVRGWLTQKAKKLSHYRLPTPGQLGLMNGLLSKILGGDRERHTWLEWTWGDQSSKALTGGQVGAIFSWLSLEQDPETSEHIPSALAVSEAKMMLRQALLDKGQADMFDAIHDAAEEEERAYDAILDAGEMAAEGGSE
ncbi:MAG: hypothetical protein ABIH46_10715 [Chloroflexota bacterium]